LVSLISNVTWWCKFLTFDKIALKVTWNTILLKVSWKSIYSHITKVLFHSLKVGTFFLFSDIYHGWSLVTHERLLEGMEGVDQVFVTIPLVGLETLKYIPCLWSIRTLSLLQSSSTRYNHAQLTKLYNLQDGDTWSIAPVYDLKLTDWTQQQSDDQHLEYWTVQHWWPNRRLHMGEPTIWERETWHV
jgi:hypothetical protein